MSKTYKIVDLSKHNTLTEKQWNLIASNCDGVILRIGYCGYGNGSFNTDSKFSEYLAKCKALNIAYGIYWFGQETTAAEGKAAADYVAKAAGDLSNYKWGVWYDSEHSSEPNHKGRGDVLTKAKRTEAAKAFIDRVNELGGLGGIYAGVYWLDSMLDDSQLKAYPHWIPQYASRCIYTGTITGWQFSSTNAFGITGLSALDCSYFYKDLRGEIMTTTEIKALVADAVKAYSALPSQLASANATIAALRKEVTALQTEVDALGSLSNTGDTVSDSFKEDTAWAKEQGIFMGDGKGNYGWNKFMTRAQLAATLHRMDGKDE